MTAGPHANPAPGSTPGPAAPSPGPSLQCMEVWGGNQAIDTGLAIPGLDVRVYSRPFGDHADGGGDVHYISQCGTGRIGRFLIADVSGHGAAVAEVAGALRGLMRRFVNYVDQSSFVARINQEFSRLADAGCFATAVVMTYWAPTDYLIMCNAGHPRPFWFRQRTGRWELLEPGRDQDSSPDQSTANLPLGILEPTTYDQIGVRLSPGDLILVYTDSLVEAKDRAGRMLGEAGLARILADLDTREPASLVAALRDRIDAFRGGSPPDDDTTILLLRHNGSRPRRLGIPQWATVIGRFFALTADSLRNRGGAIPWPQLRLDNVLGTVLDSANSRVGGHAARGERARLKASGAVTVTPPDPARPG
ncbi:MAG: serine/threonine-protein phosphatase [Phycisphaerales bacterium]|nr:serine/threonine-protein phosphatase [Phycisphaerales bacterium]